MALPDGYLHVLERLGRASVPREPRLREAQALSMMADTIDRTYLAHRMGKEGGDPGLIGL